jgi:hypothetical protein
MDQLSIEEQPTLPNRPPRRLLHTVGKVAAVAIVMNVAYDVARYDAYKPGTDPSVTWLPTSWIAAPIADLIVHHNPYES